MLPAVNETIHRNQSNHDDDNNTCTGMSSRFNVLLVSRDSSSLLKWRIEDELSQKSHTVSYYVHGCRQ